MPGLYESGWYQRSQRRSGERRVECVRSIGSPAQDGTGAPRKTYEVPDGAADAVAAAGLVSPELVFSELVFSELVFSAAVFSEVDFSELSADESEVLPSLFGSGLRESLIYHPEPLNTMPTG